MKTKVLIPVDSAHNSLTAEEYAIKLNWRMALDITLLHVVNTKRLESHGISPDDQNRIRQAMVKRGETVLATSAKPFADAQVDYQVRIEQGAPGNMICRIAENEGFDMVIIPQSGLSEWEEILGGSVVRTVLNQCRVPVLLVKHSPQQLEEQKRLRAAQELRTR